jgi:hypothetical protein
MAHIMEFPSMARPKICRTVAEAANVPLNLPIQIELAWPKKTKTINLPVPVAEEVYRIVETEAARRDISQDKLLAIISCVVTEALTRLKTAA